MLSDRQKLLLGLRAVVGMHGVASDQSLQTEHSGECLTKPVLYVRLSLDKLPSLAHSGYLQAEQPSLHIL